MIYTTINEAFRVRKVPNFVIFNKACGSANIYFKTQ